MTHIREDIKLTWQTRARRGAMLKLESLLEFRDLLSDARAEGHPPIMELYIEAAVPMMISSETLRRDIATIREYSRADLYRWLENGISFDHLDNANQLAEIAHKAPADLLNEAVDPGNATGETMTVRELQSYALGERPMPAPMYWVNRLFDSLCKSPTRWQWSEEKAQRWSEWIDQGKEFFK